MWFMKKEERNVGINLILCKKVKNLLAMHSFVLKKTRKEENENRTQQNKEMKSFVLRKKKREQKKRE